MLPEIRHLRYFVAVAEHGNFTRASERLHISQPTLSQQIRQLERTVGVQLLDRAGRTVRLTDAGRAYLEPARRVLRELEAGERAVHDVTDLSRGQLRWGVTPTLTTYLVGALTAELYDRHPGIEATVREMSQDHIESALLADELDIGIAFAAQHPPGLTALPLFSETLSLVVGEPGRDGPDPVRPMPVAALERLPLALLTGDFATRVHIDAYFAREAVTPRIAVQANSIQALTEIVRRTALATVLPDAITRTRCDLEPIALDPPLPPRSIVLLVRENGYRSAAARAFIELAGEVAARLDPHRD